MEETEINSIAKAVSVAVGKLNEDTKRQEQGKAEPPGNEPETFSCPECGTPVKANTLYCPNCGCELEWGE